MQTQGTPYEPSWKITSYSAPILSISSCDSFLPSLPGAAQICRRLLHAGKLDLWLILEFLHEVTVPMQPRLEGLETPLPTAGRRSLPRCRCQTSRQHRFLTPVFGSLPNVSQREASKGEMCAQPGAGGGRRDRAADPAGIGPPPLLKKTPQRVVCRSQSAR